MKILQQIYNQSYLSTTFPVHKTIHIASFHTKMKDFAKYLSFWPKSLLRDSEISGLNFIAVHNANAHNENTQLSSSTPLEDVIVPNLKYINTKKKLFSPQNKQKNYPFGICKSYGPRSALLRCDLWVLLGATLAGYMFGAEICWSMFELVVRMCF